MQCVAVGVRDRGASARFAGSAASALVAGTGGLLVGGVWFVNLVNFMDGIDWMTVAEVVPVTGAIVAARSGRRDRAHGLL